MKNRLAGFVQNRPDGVIAEVEGDSESIRRFSADIIRSLPPLAEIVSMNSSEVPLCGEREFRVASSGSSSRTDVHIAPDICICDECLKELFDPQNRRYRYPFINCTNCGPRLTIIKDIPYDRISTSMSCFAMCPDCRREYNNPDDRRFHAEPIACPACGPSLRLLDRDGNDISGVDPIREAINLLLKGRILAIKGLGGFHLSADASNDSAIEGLRSRKFREEKPLAVMVKDIRQAAYLAEVDGEEERLLLSAQRPIVLLRKKKGDLISRHIAPGVPDLGIMLPYTPLHYLLLEGAFRALVMTSANKVDEPICIGNREAVERLRGIADFFLVHDRDILVRCDDSVSFVSEGRQGMIRRSRGYAPKPILLNKRLPDVLALGSHMKNTICCTKGSYAFLSPHIGDMETPQARDFFHENISLMQRIAQCRPELFACDSHPEYYSSKAASDLSGGNAVRVQHHHAHVVSCMAENRISGQVIGLAMDGTGYGPDGKAWGSEFLIADEAEFIRAGHFGYFPLPGGEKAIREPWRTAVSLLKRAFGNGWQEYAAGLRLGPEGTDYDLMDRIIELKINTPQACGLGRIFDGVASILGLRRRVSFEGQAAMELEAMGRNGAVRSYPFEVGCEKDVLVIDFSPAIREITMDALRNVSRHEIAASFHFTLSIAIFAIANRIRKKTGLNRAVLSGGCFQNRTLLESCIRVMKENGFEVFRHRIVPANDGGISLGQAVSAAARTAVC